MDMFAAPGKARSGARHAAHLGSGLGEHPRDERQVIGSVLDREDTHAIQAGVGRSGGGRRAGHDYSARFFF
jgi:hypothetical protein